MAVIADIIREVSLDLNDQEPGHEYVRWPFVQLHSYLREGLIDVSYRLKDLFTSSVVIEVESGEYWQKACTCTKVLRVVGLSTSQGRITRVCGDIWTRMNSYGWGLPKPPALCSGARIICRMDIPSMRRIIRVSGLSLRCRMARSGMWL